MVRAVWDYRNARLAVQWMEEGQAGMANMAKHPNLMKLLQEIKEAQEIDDALEFPTDADDDDVP